MSTSSLGLTRDVTPANDLLIERFNYVICDVPGSFTWKVDGGSSHTLSNIMAGILYPVGNGAIVMSTGTTATGIKVV